MVSLLSSLAINLLHHHIMLKIKFNGVDPLALVPNLPFTSYILQKFLVFHEYVGLLVNSSKLLIVVLVITLHLCLLGSPDKANDLYGGQEVESLLLGFCCSPPSPELQSSTSLLHWHCRLTASKLTWPQHILRNLCFNVPTLSKNQAVIHIASIYVVHQRPKPSTTK